MLSWNEERVEMLRQLWTAGLSASQIADRLGGGLSRNAVIGKVHRLKLESRMRPSGDAAALPEGTMGAEPAPPALAEEAADIRLVSSQPMPGLALSLGAFQAELAEEAARLEADPPPAGRVSGEVVPISRRLSLVQLSERTCKWPVGDPLKPDFHFCGHHAGDSSPYCSYHARLAFQPNAERRRMR